MRVRFCEKITSQKPSGKKKLGSAWLNELSPICYVTCSDGAEYTVFSSIRGSLYVFPWLILCSACVDAVFFTPHVECCISLFGL